MNEFFQFLSDCWLPLAIACAGGIGLYYLGRAEGRRIRPSLAERARRHHARSVLFRP